MNNHPTTVKKKGKMTFEEAKILVLKQEHYRMPLDHHNLPTAAKDCPLCKASPFPKQEGLRKRFNEKFLGINIQSHMEVDGKPKKVWEELIKFIASERSLSHQQGYAEEKRSEKKRIIKWLKGYTTDQSRQSPVTMYTQGYYQAIADVENIDTIKERLEE